MMRAAIVIALWIGAVVAAGEAVSTPNGKVGYAGGSMEGEYYLKQFTLAAGAGVAGLEYENGPYPFIDDNVTDFFASAAVRYYPWDDLMLSAAYLHVFDNELVLGMVEYQTPIHGLTVFAQVAEGEHDYDHAPLGVQFYIGKAKSLIRRHREDDPPNLAPEILNGIGLYGAEFNKRARQYIEDHPAVQGGSDNGGGYGLIIEVPHLDGYGLGDTMTVSTP
jgi:hypothetical protein